jgi:hypothetical protein
MRPAFLDLPVYRLSQDDYFRQRLEFVEKMIDRAGGRERDPDIVRQIERHSSLQFGGQWIYNEIIGFIGLYFDGHQVLGKYFEVTAKRIVRTRRKIFEYKTHKLAAEISMPFQPGEPFDPTNEEIFDVVQQYVERCREALPNRWIEDAQLLKLGPFLDWKRLLAASQSGHAD